MKDHVQVHGLTELVNADVTDLARVPVFVRATAWPELAEVFRGN